MILFDTKNLEIGSRSSTLRLEHETVDARTKAQLKALAFLLGKDPLPDDIKRNMSTTQKKELRAQFKQVLEAAEVHFKEKLKR